MKPIDIQIDDDWKYGLVAFFVDNDDFLKDLKEARKQLEIENLFPRATIEKQFATADVKLTESEYSQSTQQAQKISDQFAIKLIAPTQYDDLTLAIQQKYHKSNGFHYVIKFALLCGTVVEADLQLPEPLPVSANPIQETTEVTIHPPQMALVISPGTNPEEVKRKYIQYTKFAKTDASLTGNMWLLPDVAREIRRDRNWYWQHCDKEHGGEGKSYAQIASENEFHPPQMQDRVIRAISHYKRRLETFNTSRTTKNTDT